MKFLLVSSILLLHWICEAKKAKSAKSSGSGKAKSGGGGSLAASSDDPSCTGPPVALDSYGKKMYKRKLISRYTYGTPEEGIFCHVTFQLCPGENAVTQEIDHALGDHSRIRAYQQQDGSSWCDAKSLGGIKVDGMAKCDKTRSYSPVTPLNENTVQLMVREYRSNEQKNKCKYGENCKFGMSELVCHAPIGTEFLLAVSSTGGNGKKLHKPNWSMKPGSGPYTINFIGQGVGLTEINPAVLSMLGSKTASGGKSPSPIKKINYLWTNSYWDNAAWLMGEEPAPAKCETLASSSCSKIHSSDLAREMVRQAKSWGHRFELMHSISRENPRPDWAWPRVDAKVLGQAFGLTKTQKGGQDPNVKWFVVGTGAFKKAMYALIEEWGFDLGSKDGPNFLYQPLGATGLKDRPRSYLFEKAQQEGPVNVKSSGEKTMMQSLVVTDAKTEFLGAPDKLSKGGEASDPGLVEKLLWMALGGLVVGAAFLAYHIKIVKRLQAREIKSVPSSSLEMVPPASTA